jgi:hypothetical protein
VEGSVIFLKQNNGGLIMMIDSFIDLKSLWHGRIDTFGEIPQTDLSKTLASVDN